MTAMTTTAGFRRLLMLVLALTVHGFTTQTSKSAFVSRQPRPHVDTKLMEALTESGFEKKMPSNPDAENIGIREWPKQVTMQT